MEGKGPPIRSCILLGPDVQYGGPCLSGFLGLTSAYERLSLRSHGAPELVHNQTSLQRPLHWTQLSVFPQEAPQPHMRFWRLRGLTKQPLGSGEAVLKALGAQCRTWVWGAQGQWYWAPWSWPITPAGGIPGEGSVAT